MLKRWLMAIVVGLVGLLLVVVACAPAAAPAPAPAPAPKPTAEAPKPAPGAPVPKAASVGTLPKGGLTNVLGAALGKVISDNTGISSTDRPFTGYLSYVPLINKGEVDMGIVTAPELFYAYKGEEPYEGKNTNLRLLFGGVNLRTGFFVRTDSGIKEVKDFKGKRVVWDTASKLTALNFGVAMKANGLDPDKDVTKVSTAGVVEAIRAVGEGRVDVGWSSVGAAETKEVSVKVGGVYWPPIAKSADDAAAKYVRANLPGMDVGFIKAGTAPEINNDTWTMHYPYHFVTYSNFSEEAAYLVTKAIWEHEADLVAIHPQFKGWASMMVTPKAMLPYHNGSIRFYKEKGAWTAEMEQVQKKLLGQ